MKKGIKIIIAILMVSLIPFVCLPRKMSGTCHDFEYIQSIYLGRLRLYKTVMCHDLVQVLSIDEADSAYLHIYRCKCSEYLPWNPDYRPEDPRQKPK